MKVDGRCLCGYLSYEAEVDQNLVEICNCMDCQVLSGSAFRVNVPVIDGMFKFLSGEPKTYVKTAENGNRRILAFCPECGAKAGTAKFCPQCGFKLNPKTTCPECNAEMEPNAKFCPECGHQPKR